MTSKNISDTNIDQDHIDIIKEIFENQKTLFNYDFNLLSHINQKIYNLLTFILVTIGILGLLINVVINWKGAIFQTLLIIIPLFSSGVLLTISGYYIIKIMNPHKILFPEFTSELKTSSKPEFYRYELMKIMKARQCNISLFDDTSKHFIRINNYIVLSIILILVASLFSLILFLTSLNQDYSICNILSMNASKLAET